MNNKLSVAVVFLLFGTLVTAQVKIPDTLVKEKKIDEVIIIGYGSQKKSHLTGAISKVENKDLDQIAVSRVDDALVGQVAGVNVQAIEGEAGSSPTIRIRGTGSISGSSDPLIVVDGLVVDNDYLGSLDMNNVASFEVLKDAASSAIYGSRGGNGVILITTKQGKDGKTKFSYNTFFGVKSAYHSDAYTYDIAGTAARELAETGALSARTQYIQRLGINTDWQDVIFDGGTIESHTISARGGSKSTKFSSSLGYVHDEGVLLTDDFKKYSFSFKLDTKISDKFKIGFNLSPSYTNTRRFDGSTHDVLRQAPWLPVYLDAHSIQFVNRLRDNGKYANVKIGDYAQQRMFDNFDLVTGMPVATGGTSISDTSNTNPAAKILEKNRTQQKFKMFGSMYGEYSILDDLKFRAVVGGDFQNTDVRRWQGIKADLLASSAQLDLGSANTIHLVTENYFTYDKSFGNHDITAVAGVSAEHWQTNGNEVSAAGYTSDLIQTIQAGSVSLGGRSYEYEEALLSYYSRLNYAYNNKYLLSVSFRKDGSSIFGENNKYGNFPAASVGWAVSKENFLQSSKVISNLKLRASYGFTGNKDLRIEGQDGYLIQYYPSLSLLNSSTAIINNAPVNGYNPLNISNPFLQWERSQELDFGLDYGLFKNKISGSFDIYQRTSDQLLLNNPISGTTGFTNAIANLGKVRNSGLEVEIRTKNISTEKFKWSSTILASKNKNELLDFGDSNGLIQNVDDKRAAEWINLVGNPISSFYGWVVDSEIPAQYINNPYFPIGGQAQHVYVKDLNGDGLIDDEDKTILGNPYPDLVWSFTNDFTIGNFNISFMFQGSHGAEVRNIGDQYIFNHFNSAQSYNVVTTPNQGFIKEKIFTNAIIQDASYIAWRNLNVGYNFSKDMVAKFDFINSARVYASGQNLMYFMAKGYTGLNPESINTTSPTTYGYQRAGSPIFRTISLGLNLEF
ncbi:SusC/RagA family TonB-linked outer membrane protein [Kaistella flava (ex Peng et al. 2021)]|uniref:SusC/RagA family TonB-linked outer membrane protein n=1 Tax=Kaistella flava (ex Peng et al. 2021) TaxID=2038776 RepID=A0A7M2Y9S1_9FLAO|nr:SusC/RagA family TonB-linked outer membrane protein [Kaistella flava (ex Peng et al. 2021)]QOW10405.1 SusC/RagA family TonB-linked outer membrane protein [Kaistella flava (ex Peng et al. 2021)]